MKLKDSSVNVHDLVPEMKDRLPELDKVYADYHTEMVVTSGKDGKHGVNSLHYEGKAVDLRTWSVLAALVEDIRNTLGPDYDVVLEKDHIHIEYDPLHNRVVG